MSRLTTKQRRARRRRRDGYAWARVRALMVDLPDLLRYLAAVAKAVRP